MDLSESSILIFALSTVVLGMIFLVKSGDWIVDGAVHLARAFGVPPLLVGFTIVAIGTSLPELIVSINANLKDSPGVAIGNVVGSNIANILLVIGAGALFGTMVAHRRKLAADMIAMMIATFIAIGLIFYGFISNLIGFGMIVLLTLYIFFQYKITKKQHVTEEFDIEAEDLPFNSTKQASMFVLLGAAGIAAGAELMVRGAITSAEIMSIPDAVIGLTVIAIGTSLPELSTAIIAAMKKQGDIVLGNVVGSNVFNIMMILGVMAMVKPVSLENLAPQIMQFDVWVMLASSALFCALVFTPGKFTRGIGIVFLSGYAAYIGYMYVLNSV